MMDTIYLVINVTNVIRFAKRVLPIAAAQVAMKDISFLKKYLPRERGLVPNKPNSHGMRSASASRIMSGNSTGFPNDRITLYTATIPQPLVFIFKPGLPYLSEATDGSL